MKNNSFICVYIILNILAIGVSIILALLKMTNITTISWVFVMSPILGLLTLIAIVLIIALSVTEIKSACGRKKYITKNITE